MSEEFSESSILTCPVCQGTWARPLHPGDPPPPFCAFCGYYRSSLFGETLETSQVAQEKPPVQERIGHYHLIRQIATGGMGEIYLVYDPICRRNIALKRVRTDLQNRRSMRRRFLREAWITGQLTHPGIVPVYNIHADGESLYYTMPYVEGETLREILRRARRELKEGRPTSSEHTIPALMRIFLTICQTVAYVHSRSVIHRDLKPDNIIIGKYGEVAILDWGLAKWTFEEEEEEEFTSEYDEVAQLTVPGKIFGTLSHLAPECCLGEAASRRSDIFALGVILYQILALTLPFQRPGLKEIREAVSRESFVDPVKVAPYRDIPQVLSRITERCLQHEPNRRYAAVDELLRDIRGYLLGQSDWFEVAHLDPSNRNHWEMAEYIFIPHRLAVTGHAEGREWAKVMISRSSFTGNTRLTGRLRIRHQSEGVGLLTSVTERALRRDDHRGLCMWLGTDPKVGSRLFRSGAEVSSIPNLHLEADRWYFVDLRKEDNHLYLYLDGELVYTYLNYLPIVGTHVGLMFRDGEFDLHDFRVAIGNLSLKVNCLAIPDAFLEANMYERALAEYRRIAYSFPDRSEGREARFRAGITLLQQAHDLQPEQDAEATFDAALEEFGKLHATPGAPLEYLGKSLVYHSQGESDDEVNTLELALRRYPNHPMIDTLSEHIRVRLSETSRFQRELAYRYALLITRHLPELLPLPDTASFMQKLRENWEPIHFLLPVPEAKSDEKIDRLSLATPLAFWLGRPYVLGEILDDYHNHSTISLNGIANTLLALVELGAFQLANQKLEESLSLLSDHPEAHPLFALLRIPILSYKENPNHAVHELLVRTRNGHADLYLRVALQVMDRALAMNQPELVHYLIDHLPPDLLPSSEEKIWLDSRKVWAYLLADDWYAAGELLNQYPLEMLDSEASWLRILFGCWLVITESAELGAIHFAGSLERRYPRTWGLLGHYLAHRIPNREEWEQQAFLWERRWLYRQLVLYYHCLGDMEQETHYRNLERKEYIYVTE